MIKRGLQEISVYFIIAVVGLGTNIGSRFVYDIVIGFYPSVVFSYFTGMLVAFSLTKLFMFDAKNSGNTRKEFFRFFLVTCFALCITLFFSWLAMGVLRSGYLGEFENERALLGETLGKSPTLETSYETIAHLVGVGFGFFGNFFGHKYFSFRTIPV